MTYRVCLGPDGSIQEALDSLPDDGEKAVVCLSEGVFRQRAVIRRRNTVLLGLGPDRTKITASLAALEKMPDGEKRGTFRTYTVMTDAENVTLRGLTIENAAWPREEAGQAVALYADGALLFVEDCRLLGFQDTLFTGPLPEKEVEKNGFRGPKQFLPRAKSRQLYRRCEIRGDVDFIFGGAQALFEDCLIVTRDGRRDRSAPFVGYVCAPSTLPGDREGYTFVRCRLIGDGVPDGSVYLARPWREGACAAFWDCELGAHIHPAGFADWADRGKNGTVRFSEKGSFGPGAEGERAPFATKG